MLFKIGVVLVFGFAIFTLLSAIYAHISYSLIKMKHEGKTIEPRDIVKANAEIYRNNELIRMEKENYNRWLAVHNDEVTMKNHPNKNDFFNYEY